MRSTYILKTRQLIINLAVLLSVVFGMTMFLTQTTNAQGAGAAGAAAAGGVACSGTGSARTKCEACKGTGGTYAGDTCNDDTGGATEDKVANISADVVNIFSFVVGVVAVIMIIIGGFKYVVSSGDANNISSAKNTILYAIVGLVIVAFAQIIVRYVLNRI